MWWGHFTLQEHGDAYERLWGHFLAEHFSEWERFWVHHVVPLTNRIEDGHTGPTKLFTRSDRRLQKVGLEQLMMTNYSVFYFLARSCVIVESDPHLFPEDAFIFLQTTMENIDLFMRAFTERIARRLNLDKARVPVLDIRSTEVGKTIETYRNSLVHSSRLGRNPKLSPEHIPLEVHLHHSMLSWSYVQNLPEDQFVDGRKYLKELQAKLMKQINPVWKQITDLMDEQRDTDKYIQLYQLEKDATGKFRPVKTG